jgi:hypothetical protein
MGTSVCVPPLISRRREGRAGVLTNGKSWNFTYMIEEEDEEEDEEDMEIEKEEDTGRVKPEKTKRIELYQLQEIIADNEDDIRRIIGIDRPWHC